MHKTGLFLVPLIFVSALFAQAQEHMLDVLYLKNGSIIKGEIIEISRDRKVKIQTTDNKTWVFNMDEIHEIKRETGHLKLHTGEFLRPGFINYTSAGLLVGDKNADQSAPFSITTVNGHMFKNKISVGGGLGLEFLDVTSIPLFADIRYYFNTRRLSPYISFQAGYSFPVEDERDEYNQERDNTAGYLVNPGLGFLVNLYSGNSLIFIVGYRHQVLHYEYNDFYDTQISQYYNRFNIRFGLVFR